ncbi:hypothetical protein EON64_18625, partial [archaeon]
MSNAARRSFTLAREGIKPLACSSTISSRGLDSTGAGKGISTRPTGEGEEEEEAVHLGYNWFQVSRKHSGVLTKKGRLARRVIRPALYSCYLTLPHVLPTGRHLCLEAHRDRSFLCLYGLKAPPTPPIPPVPHTLQMSCQFKLPSQPTPLLILVLPNPPLLLLWCLDPLLRCATLYRIRGPGSLPQCKGDLKNLDVLVSQPVTLPSPTLNKFFSLHLLVTKDGEGLGRVKVDIGNSATMDATYSLDPHHPGGGHMGLLVVKGGIL